MMIVEMAVRDRRQISSIWDCCLESQRIGKTKQNKTKQKNKKQRKIIFSGAFFFTKCIEHRTVFPSHTTRCLRLLLQVQILVCSYDNIMWHYHREWVGCREYWFWVTSLEMWQILMFYIVFELQSIVHMSTTRYLIEMGFGSKCH